MDLVTLAIGIAVGAIFSPFWMKMFDMVKSWFASKM